MKEVVRQGERWEDERRGGNEGGSEAGRVRDGENERRGGNEGGSEAGRVRDGRTRGGEEMKEVVRQGE